MYPLGVVWQFTRKRLADVLDGLSDAQLRFRPFPTGHSAGEYALHVAGAECYWATWLSAGLAPSPVADRLERAVFGGFLAEGPFEFSDEEITVSSVRDALDYSGSLIRPIITAPSQEQLAASLISPIGDPVDGLAGLARLAQHAGYHTGQIVLLTQHPEFPS